MNDASDPDPGSALRFPCRFPIKVMGRHDPGFEATVLALIGSHVDGITPADVRAQPSRGGRYVSITVTITADSRAQLDAIYRSLSAEPQVLVVL